VQRREFVLASSPLASQTAYLMFNQCDAIGNFSRNPQCPSALERVGAMNQFNAMRRSTPGRRACIFFQENRSE
jgi:hypothetical protein